MENRKRRIQCTEKTRLRLGTSIQQKLSGCEKSLLSDLDRAHDWTAHGGMGRDMEKGKAEFGAET